MPVGVPHFVYCTVVRASDEDLNRHTNHAAAARFVEDALAALAADAQASFSAPALDFLALEYVAESRMADLLELKLFPLENTGELGVLMHRASNGPPQLLLRGRVGTAPAAAL